MVGGRGHKRGVTTPSPRRHPPVTAASRINIVVAREAPPATVATQGDSDTRTSRNTRPMQWLLR